MLAWFVFGCLNSFSCVLSFKHQILRPLFLFFLTSVRLSLYPLFPISQSNWRQSSCVSLFVKRKSIYSNRSNLIAFVIEEKVTLRIGYNYRWLEDLIILLPSSYVLISPSSCHVYGSAINHIHYYRSKFSQTGLKNQITNTREQERFFIYWFCLSLFIDLGVGEFVPLDVDHVDVCKPSSQTDERYLRTLQFIREILSN